MGTYSRNSYIPGIVDFGMRLNINKTGVQLSLHRVVQNAMLCKTVFPISSALGVVCRNTAALARSNNRA